ncbi:Chorismate pyruvate-lyase/UbiC transcription regulator-associated domain [Phytophthora cactorum]|nr:Chorismate pyruvate-lyase/UbiC transcription regulator-associated domain [Phytophthora cactorum]
MAATATSEYCYGTNHEAGAPHIKAATMVADPKTATKETTSTLVSTAAVATEHGNEDRGWYKLEVTFQASPETMLLGHAEMSAAWRLFLFGNGSPTHHLGLLTGSPTEVDVLGMLPVGNSADNAPSEIEAIALPRCRRQVFLRNARGERLGYAASWINVEDVGAVFKDTKIPIGKNILQHKTELYRDMKSVFCGHSDELERPSGRLGRSGVALPLLERRTTCHLYLRGILACAGEVYGQGAAIDDANCKFQPLERDMNNEIDFHLPANVHLVSLLQPLNYANRRNRPRTRLRIVRTASCLH